MTVTTPLQPFSHPSESLPQIHTYPYSSHDDLLDYDSPYSSSDILFDGHSLHSSPDDPFNDDLPSESRGNSPHLDSEPRDSLFTRVWRIIVKFLPDLLPKGLGLDDICKVIEDLYEWLVDLFQGGNSDADSDAMESTQALGGTHHTPNPNGMSHVAEKYQVQAGPIAHNTAGGGSTGRSPSTERRASAPVRRGGVPERVPRQGDRSERSKNVPVSKSRSSSETGLRPDVRSHRQRL